MHRLAVMILNTKWIASHLDCGTVLSTKRNIAFSDGSWILFLMIHMNWATVMSEGTKYFLLSISTIWDPETFSTMTCKVQVWRSGCSGLVWTDSFGRLLARTGLQWWVEGMNKKVSWPQPNQSEVELAQHCKTWFYSCTETPVYIHNGLKLPVPVFGSHGVKRSVIP